MKAISTKVLNGTATKCARIKAFDCDGNSLTISEGALLNEHGISDGITSETAAQFVASELAISMGWNKPNHKLVGGWTKHGYVFVFVDKTNL
jgi:hypothetical protein